MVKLAKTKHLLGIDYILFSLGEFTTFHSLTGNQRPQFSVFDPSTKAITSTFTKDTPDQILVQGRLDSPAHALLSYHLRGGSSVPGSIGGLWRIYGEKGEIEITASGLLLQTGYPDLKVRLQDYEKDEVKELEVPRDEWEELPLPARNIARLYEKFADSWHGGEKMGRLPDWEEALVRHRMIEGVFIRGEEAQKADYRE